MRHGRNLQNISCKLLEKVRGMKAPWLRLGFCTSFRLRQTFQTRSGVSLRQNGPCRSSKKSYRNAIALEDTMDTEKKKETPSADESDKRPPGQDNQPFVDKVIDIVVDGAAALTKVAAKSVVRRVAKSAKKTKAGKAVVAVAKKAKKAVPKKSVKKSKSPGRKSASGKKSRKTAAKKKKSRKSKR
jgi:hypothetical protein